MNAYLMGYMSKEANTPMERQDQRRQGAAEADYSRLRIASQPRRTFTYPSVRHGGSSGYDNLNTGSGKWGPSSPPGQRGRQQQHTARDPEKYTRSEKWAPENYDARQKTLAEARKNLQPSPGPMNNSSVERESNRLKRESGFGRGDSLTPGYMDGYTSGKAPAQQPPESSPYTGGRVASNAQATQLLNHVTDNPDYDWKQHVAPSQHARFEGGIQRWQQQQQQPPQQQPPQQQPPQQQPPESSPYTPEEQMKNQRIDRRIEQERRERPTDFSRFQEQQSTVPSVAPTPIQRHNQQQSDDYGDYVHQSIDATNERIADSRRQTEDMHRRGQDQRRQIEEQDRRSEEQRQETERLLGRSL